MIKRPLSKHYPILKKPIKITKIVQKRITYLKPTFHLTKKVQEENLYKIKKHKSVLRRKLGDSNEHLQEQKIKNLQIAADKFNDLIIKPGQTISFWKNLGEPRYDKGFVDGMILDNGKVIIGLGGGLCQIANLLYWLFLHTPLKVKEHHHHQLDIFPDSGRVLPFGSGAGVLYNYGDLQFCNSTKYTFYLKTWVDDTYLHGEIYSLNQEFPNTYKIIERDHLFYKIDSQIYRKNKIFRITREKQGGKKISEELMTINNSKVLYNISDEQMVEKNSFYREKQIKSDRIANQVW